MTQHSRHSHPINVELWRDTQSVICTDQEDVTYITHWPRNRVTWLFTSSRMEPLKQNDVKRVACWLQRDSINRAVGEKVQQLPPKCQWRMWSASSPKVGVLWGRGRRRRGRADGGGWESGRLKRLIEVESKRGRLGGGGTTSEDERQWRESSRGSEMQRIWLSR